ncbi:MAG: methyltransferase domain-containing protein [Actinomycetota bacterium]|nr:methyltransferase domain-containing protein [Actinomycetota bacterium]
MAPAGTYIEANGLKIYYETYGEGEPLLLVHGRTATPRSRASHLPAFAEHFRVFTVFSLVLCTVPDLGRALAEARHVLRPGGTLRFYEHVRAADAWLTRWQDLLERPWGWIGGGRHPNRETAAAVTAAGFIVLSLEEFDFPVMPPIVRPHVIGIAERPLA